MPDDQPFNDQSLTRRIEDAQRAVAARDQTAGELRGIRSELLFARHRLQGLVDSLASTQARHDALSRFSLSALVALLTFRGGALDARYRREMERLKDEFCGVQGELEDLEQRESRLERTLAAQPDPDAQRSELARLRAEAHVRELRDHGDPATALTAFEQRIDQARRRIKALIDCRSAVHDAIQAFDAARDNSSGQHEEGHVGLLLAERVSRTVSKLHQQMDELRQLGISIDREAQPATASFLVVHAARARSDFGRGSHAIRSLHRVLEQGLAVQNAELREAEEGREAARRALG